MGCAHSTRVEEVPILPDVSALGCCWQATEAMHIRDAGSEFEVMSVIAVTNDGLTLILLDPLQRRWLTLNQRGQDVVIDRAIDTDKDLPLNLLLLAVYLKHLGAIDWEGSIWEVEVSGSSKILSQNGKALIRLDSRPAPEEDTVDIYYPTAKIAVAVKTTSRVTL